MAPPSFVKFLHKNLAFPFLYFEETISRGIEKYIPLSKLPSPNSSEDISVFVAKKPKVKPDLKDFEIPCARVYLFVNLFQFPYFSLILISTTLDILSTMPLIVSLSDCTITAFLA